MRAQDRPKGEQDGAYRENARTARSGMASGKASARGGVSIGTILDLQRTAENAAVAEMLDRGGDVQFGAGAVPGGDSALAAQGPAPAPLISAGPSRPPP